MTFETIFPGHYEGRATHTHLLTKSNVTLRENATTEGGAVTHIGQVFWPEDLITDVETLEPYNTNTVERTTNDEDMWSIVQAEDDYDPFPEFVYLGDSVSDGLMAWIQIGINASADHSDDDYYAVAATYYEGGGVANADSGFVGGGGGNGTNGTMPTGAIPTDLSTGAATEAAASTEIATSSVLSSSALSAPAIPSDLPSGLPSGAPRGSGAPAGPRPSGAAQPSGGFGGERGNNAATGKKQQKQGQPPTGGPAPSGFSTSALPTPRV